jgi:hypothetical protein
MRKAAFAIRLAAPRLTATVRKLAYQRTAKAAIVAAIRMNDLLVSQPASRRIGAPIHGAHANALA